MGNPADWNQVAAASSAAAQQHFGDPARELDAARAGAFVSPLTHFTLLRFSGADAQSFLQSQLTCDLREVTPVNAQYGGYCSPQGRLLATFLLMLAPQGYLMLLPAGLAEPIATRLNKFILRSKVKIDREESIRAVGLGGPESAAVLGKAIGQPPIAPMEMLLYPAASLLRLPGNAFLALVPSDGIGSLWNSLAALAVPAGAAAWDWLQVRSGIPWITLPTQDQFVPQMVGLDAVGGISFDKGCYPGQEIVARTHYLGEVKRQLRSGHVDHLAQAGDELVAAGQKRAVVVNAAPSPEGGYDLLAVAQTAADGEPLYLRTESGPAIRLSTLPY
ncbi:MAG TPA: folate-binding protein [Burkholderiales bacterium]|nr:folate-binding protein [Burkholderiales bacterium]